MQSGGFVKVSLLVKICKAFGNMLVWSMQKCVTTLKVSENGNLDIMWAGFIICAKWLFKNANVLLFCILADGDSANGTDVSVQNKMKMCWIVKYHHQRFVDCDSLTRLVTKNVLLMIEDWQTGPLIKFWGPIQLLHLPLTCTQEHYYFSFLLVIIERFAIHLTLAALVAQD